MTRSTLIAAAALFAAAEAAPLAAAELAGSPASMRRQHGVAQAEGHVFARTPEQVSELVDEGRLVELPGNDDYDVIARWPYALLEVKVFIERFAAEYRAATGERLVVTSLTRPAARQPTNAHPLSVHPAGMALDLRVPANARARSWLENALLGLERRGILDATRERRPPHYHIALFPGSYRAYVENRWGPEVFEASLEPMHAAHEHDEPAPELVAGLAAGGAVNGARPGARLLSALLLTGITAPGLWLIAAGRRPWRRGAAAAG
jgi:hypothetical protein